VLVAVAHGVEIVAAQVAAQVVVELEQMQTPVTHQAERQIQVQAVAAHITAQVVQEALV
jgi:hypothetical protein